MLYIYRHFDGTCAHSGSLMILPCVHAQGIKYHTNIHRPWVALLQYYHNKRPALCKAPCPETSICKHDRHYQRAEGRRQSHLLCRDWSKETKVKSKNTRTLVITPESASLCLLLIYMSVVSKFCFQFASFPTHVKCTYIPNRQKDCLTLTWVIGL